MTALFKSDNKKPILLFNLANEDKLCLQKFRIANRPCGLFMVSVLLRQERVCVCVRQMVIFIFQVIISSNNAALIFLLFK